MFAIATSLIIISEIISIFPGYSAEQTSRNEAKAQMTLKCVISRTVGGERA